MGLALVAGRSLRRDGRRRNIPTIIVTNISMNGGVRAETEGDMGLSFATMFEDVRGELATDHIEVIMVMMLKGQLDVRGISTDQRITGWERIVR
jgi:hypothetical protein